MNGQKVKAARSAAFRRERWSSGGGVDLRGQRQPQNGALDCGEVLEKDHLKREFELE